MYELIENDKEGLSNVELTQTAGEQHSVLVEEEEKWRKKMEM